MLLYLNPACTACTCCCQDVLKAVHSVMICTLKLLVVCDAAFIYTHVLASAAADGPDAQHLGGRPAQWQSCAPRRCPPVGADSSWPSSIAGRHRVTLHTGVSSHVAACMPHITPICQAQIDTCNRTYSHSSRYIAWHALANRTAATPGMPSIHAAAANGPL